MTRSFLSRLFVLFAFLAAGSLAQAVETARNVSQLPVAGTARRIALVIGNGDYQHADNLPKLANPTNDAEDIAAALRGFGFEVIERKNLTLEAMNQTVAEFGSRIGGSEAALFYFAGHGIQVKSQNYLMPVDAKIDSEAAVPYKGVNVNQILDEMENGRSAANIVMLDACRNNPITGKFRSGNTRGLAVPASPPKGTVIVYATDPGNVAADGDGRNGLFSAGLLTAFKGKELSLDEVLTVASAEVERASGNNQTPYVNGPKTLQKNFYFRLTVDPGKAEIEKTFWASIERSSDPADFEAYLRKYPNGSYRALAENQLKRLKAKPAEPSPTPVIATSAPAEKPAAPKPAPPPVAVVQEDPETAFWNEVKANGAKEYYEAYVKQYPKGKYLPLAKLELKKIDDREKAQQAKEEAERKAELARLEAEKKAAAERERQDQQRAEQEAWERAKSADSEYGYRQYLDVYPKGRYATLAQAAQQKAQREAAEREKQAAAQRRAEEERQRVEAEQRRQAQAASRPQARLIAERYQDNGDGTVTDVKTRLQWMRCAIGQNWNGSTCVGSASEHAWEDARQLRSNLAGHSDWRLPTREELRSLVYCSSGQPATWNESGNSCAGTYQNPTIVAEAFPNTAAWFFWSGSPYAGDSVSAWYVGFDDGADSWIDRSYADHVRLVRAGQ
jgi:hypothetical protein